MIGMNMAQEARKRRVKTQNRAEEIDCEYSASGLSERGVWQTSNGGKLDHYSPECRHLVACSTSASTVGVVSRGFGS